ncbi:MAG TPA: (Fe-S)-binding protein [Syntrophorhabdaceae bacterium]|nr:(Fe-S)-binding protein [Syntrophorhabdaceae bacterium]
MVMTFKDYKYSDIIHRCFKCGYCKFPENWIDVNNCPPYGRFRMESYSCGGRLWLTRAWLTEQLKWSEHLAEILYACTTCKNCEVKCPLRFSGDIVNMVVAAREVMVEKGTIPNKVKTFFENVELYGNPYGLSKSQRASWANNGIERFNSHKYLLYVGCAGSYDERAKKAIFALARILKKAGVSFGILAEDEVCDGNEIRSLGEQGLFEILAEQNIEMFKKNGVRDVITFSPHAYNVFKNYYPASGGNFNVYHYTHILYDLLLQKRLRLKDSRGLKITYHDPCFLGRWHKEYEIPRQVIRAIPDAQFIEMEKSRDASLCCGGGSGNFYIDLLGGSPDSPARRRIREALTTGADIVATSCPKCLIMLEDAAKEEGLDQVLTVKDLSEIIEGLIEDFYRF